MIIRRGAFLRDAPAAVAYSRFSAETTNARRSPGTPAHAGRKKKLKEYDETKPFARLGSFEFFATRTARGPVQQARVA